MKPVGTFIVYSREDVPVGAILNRAPVVARFALGGGVFEYQINHSRAECKTDGPLTNEPIGKKWWR